MSPPSKHTTRRRAFFFRALRNGNPLVRVQCSEVNPAPAGYFYHEGRAIRLMALSTELFDPHPGDLGCLVTKGKSWKRLSTRFIWAFFCSLLLMAYATSPCIKQKFALASKKRKLNRDPDWEVVHPVSSQLEVRSSEQKGRSNEKSK